MGVLWFELSARGDNWAEWWDMVRHSAEECKVPPHLLYRHTAEAAEHDDPQDPNVAIVKGCMMTNMMSTHMAPSLRDHLGWLNNEPKPYLLLEALEDLFGTVNSERSLQLLSRRRPNEATRTITTLNDFVDSFYRLAYMYVEQSMQEINVQDHDKAIQIEGLMLRIFARQLWDKLPEDARSKYRETHPSSEPVTLRALHRFDFGDVPLPAPASAPIPSPPVASTSGNVSEPGPVTIPSAAATTSDPFTATTTAGEASVSTLTQSSSKDPKGKTKAAEPSSANGISSARGPSGLAPSSSSTSASASAQAGAANGTPKASLPSVEEPVSRARAPVAPAASSSKAAPTPKRDFAEDWFFTQSSHNISPVPPADFKATNANPVGHWITDKLGNRVKVTAIGTASIIVQNSQSAQPHSVSISLLIVPSFRYNLLKSHFDSPDISLAKTKEGLEVRRSNGKVIMRSTRWVKGLNVLNTPFSLAQPERRSVGTAVLDLACKLVIDGPPPGSASASASTSTSAPAPTPPAPNLKAEPVRVPAPAPAPAPAQAPPRTLPTGDGPDEREWYITTSSHHATSMPPADFEITTANPVDHFFVDAYGNRRPVAMIGTMRITVQDSVTEPPRSIRLYDVLIVPGLPYNILSHIGSKPQRRGATENGNYIVRRHNKTVYFSSRGKKNGNLLLNTPASLKQRLQEGGKSLNLVNNLVFGNTGRL